MNRNRNIPETLRVGAVTVFFAAMLAGCGGVDTRQALKQASDAAAEGRWEASIELLNAVLDSDPDSIPARVLRGICRHQSRRTTEALEDLERAANSAPDHFESHYFFGWVLVETGNYAEALLPLRRAHELRPKHVDTLVMLSRCCIEQGLARNGIEYLSALKDHKTFARDPALYNSLAVLWLQLQNEDRAWDNFKRARAMDANNLVVLQNLAVFHDQYRNDLSKALRYYRRCLSASQEAKDVSHQAAIVQRLREIARQRRSQ